MRVYRIASVLALLLLAVRGWPAECSWPAGEAGDWATYPNQGHRIEKNGQNLHIIYDAYNYYDPFMNQVYYVGSTDLGQTWCSLEPVDLGVTETDREYHSSMDVDGNNKAWIAAAAVYPGGWCPEVFCGSVRRSARNYNGATVWNPNQGALTAYAFNSTSVVLSPSGGSEPMAYAVVAANRYFDGILVAVELYFVPWDTVSGEPALPENWEEPQLITSVSEPPRGEDLRASIAVSGHNGYDTIHVAYERLCDGVSRVFYIKNTNAINPSIIRDGTAPSWDTPHEVSDDYSVPATSPCVEFDDGCDSVLVAWRGKPGSKGDVFRNQRKIEYPWPEVAWNVSQSSSYESDYPTLSTRCGVGWHEETEENYDPKAWLDGHLEVIKTTGGDSTSLYPHIAVAAHDEYYGIDCHTAWTEWCEVEGVNRYKVWYKKYSYIPRIGGGGQTEGWVRLADGQSLLQVWPNPCLGRTRVAFYLPADQNCLVQVCDVSGRPVRTLVNSARAAGAHLVLWNGLDDAGSAVPTGTYCCRLHSGSSTSSRVLVLTR